MAAEARCAEVGRGKRIGGYSVPAAGYVSFDVEWPSDDSLPNWRETLRCPTTGLINRARAAYHAAVASLTPGARVYVTEQMSQFYEFLKGLPLDVTGSEYLEDGTPPGSRNANGVRCEDLTRLSFSNQSFDVVMSFDVFEHVPDFRSGFAECARVLRPGGVFVMTVPFLLGSPDTVVRATVRPDGSIEHLLPPAYHGDPLRSQGVLCFYDYGWDVLAHLRNAGFAEAEVVTYWSAAYGYLGATQMMIIAKR